MDELISGMKYLDQVKDANVGALTELSELQTELEAKKLSLIHIYIVAFATVDGVIGGLRACLRLVGVALPLVLMLSVTRLTDVYKRQPIYHPGNTRPPV